MGSVASAKIHPPPPPPPSLPAPWRHMGAFRTENKRGPGNRTGNFKLLKGVKRRNVASFPKLWMLEGVPRGQPQPEGAWVGSQRRVRKGWGLNSPLTGPRGTAKVRALLWPREGHVRSCHPGPSVSMPEGSTVLRDDLVTACPS